MVYTPEPVLIQTLYNSVSVIDDLHQFIHQLFFSLPVPVCFQMICSNTNTLSIRYLSCSTLCCVECVEPAPGFSISLLSSCSTLGCCSSRSWVFPLHIKTTWQCQLERLSMPLLWLLVISPQFLYPTLHMGYAHYCLNTFPMRCTLKVWRKLLNT